VFVVPFVVGGSPPLAGPTVALAVLVHASAIAQAARTAMDLMELVFMAAILRPGAPPSHRGSP
jgi:hypothetical protein